MTMHDSNCVFCKIIEGSIPSINVYESENVLAFMDVEPIEKGHVLVVPKPHWPTIMDVPVKDASDIECSEEMMYIVRVVARALCSAFADGVNILQANGTCAGQTVGHIHFHVVPRRKTGPVPPVWKSGAGQYADEAEREGYAEKIKEAVSRIIAEEDLI